MNINMWGNSNLKRRVSWFLVLMIWVGMVTAVVMHRTPEGQQKLSKKNEKQKVDIQTEPASEAGESKPPENLEQVSSSINPPNVKEVNEKAEQKGKDFFVEYRVERDQARSEQINLLREMINNPNSDKDLKSEAQEKLLRITDNIEKEMEIESLIRARGYKDGIAFIHDESAEVIVAAEGLTKKDAAKIGDIVANTTGIPRQEITIIEKPNE